MIYRDKPYKKEAEFVYNWAKKPKTILELGCGTGQHARYWASKAKITAVDRSLDMLKLAYRHKNIKYLNQNIYELNFDKEFDCVVAMFNVMGYCCLHYILECLPIKAGGYFIFDAWNAGKFKILPPGPRVKFLPYGYRVSIPQQLDERSLKIDFIITQNNRIEVFESHDVHGFFDKDVKVISEANNFKIIDIKKTKNWTQFWKLQKL